MAAKRGIVVWMMQVICLLVGFHLAFGAMELSEKLKQVPLYPGSKIQQIMDMGIQSMAILSVRVDRDALLDFYRQDLKSKGWKLVAQFEEEDGAGITFSKDRQLIQIAVKKGDAEGMLQYQLIFISEN
jgi:hypothetical protein